MEQMPIAGIADQCATEFASRVASYSDDVTEELDGEKQFLETQNARFNLWANSIGK